MKKPAMILFDYGQTLIAEAPFDGVAGMRALMKHAVRNKYNYTPEQLWAERKAIYRDMGRVGTDWRYKILMETPNYMQMNLLFESLGIEIDLPPEAMDRMHGRGQQHCLFQPDSGGTDSASDSGPPL